MKVPSRTINIITSFSRNMLLTNNDVIKISDFGLAATVGNEVTLLYQNNYSQHSW